MDEIEQYLIDQIKICGNDMTMEGEKHAFKCTLQKVKEQQLLIHSVVGRSEQLLGFGKYLQKWSNTFLSEEHLNQEIENYLKDK